MTSNVDEQLMTVADVASVLGFHPQTVYEKVASGEIPCVRIGRSIRFDRDDFNRWLNERKASAERAAS